MINLDLVAKYSPSIYFDEKEPFFPIRIGVTFFSQPGKSPSIKDHNINFDLEKIDYVIEYAIYFDYDIGHLYELEHFWVYVGKDGTVVDAEASFHGDYFKALFKDRRNLEDRTHVAIYSQPGKHAFAPSIEFLELVPNLNTAPYEEAGDGGLLVPYMFYGAFDTNDEINGKVTAYLQSVRFRPSMKFNRYTIAQNLYVTWEQLVQEIPQRINKIVSELRTRHE
jgi:hypothetical protein